MNPPKDHPNPCSSCPVIYDRYCHISFFFLWEWLLHLPHQSLQILNLHVRISLGSYCTLKLTCHVCTAKDELRGMNQSETLAFIHQQKIIKPESPLTLRPLYPEEDELTIRLLVSLLASKRGAANFSRACTAVSEIFQDRGCTLSPQAIADLTTAIRFVC